MHELNEGDPFPFIFFKNNDQNEETTTEFDDIKTILQKLTKFQAKAYQYQVQLSKLYEENILQTFPIYTTLNKSHMLFVIHKLLAFNN